jgi:hypothetical protein
MAAAGWICRMRYSIGKAWFPRRCFICEEKGGWGENNVDHIRVYSQRWNYYWGHFHEHCLKDAICCPGNYENWVVEKAVNIRNKWEDLLLKDRMEQKEKAWELKKAQQSICNGG